MNKLIALIIVGLVACTTTGKAELMTVKDSPQSTANFVVNDDTVQILGYLHPLPNSEPLDRLRSLPKGSNVNILIQSQGGIAQFAVQFLDAMEGLNTTCFAREANGVAFTIFQQCKKRLVADDSILVAQELTVQLPSQIMPLSVLQNLVKTGSKLEKQLTFKTARRLGFKSSAQFIKAIKHRKTFRGNLIFRYKVADELADIQFDSTTTDITRVFPFGPHKVPVTLSANPYPRELKTDNIPLQLILRLGLTLDAIPESYKVQSKPREYRKPI